MLEYTLFGRLQNMLLTNNNIIKSIEYGQDVELTVLVEVGGEEALIKAVVENTNNRAIIVCGQKEYITLNGDGKLLQD